MRRRLIAALALTLAAAACDGAAGGADPDLQEQYLQVASVAGQRAGLDAVSDADWLEVADLICERRLLTDADYDAFIAEMAQEAPSPAMGRAMQDVGRTAIFLFCPP